MSNLQTFEAYKKTDHGDKQAIFIGGIPKESKIPSVKTFLQTITGNGYYTIIIDSKGTLRGFAFMLFSSKEEADSFLSKEYTFEGKKLDIKYSLDHDYYITSSLINMREPKKVFVDDIPLKFSKSQIQDIFKAFGNVTDVIIIEKLKKNVNFAYISYDDTNVAQEVVKMSVIKFDEETKLPVTLAKPKFSKNMMTNIPVEFQNYIKDIQTNIRKYCPKDFAKLEDLVLKSRKIKDKVAYYNSLASMTSPNENYIGFNKNKSRGWQKFYGGDKIKQNPCKPKVKQHHLQNNYTHKSRNDSNRPVMDKCFEPTYHQMKYQWPTYSQNSYQQESPTQREQIMYEPHTNYNYDNYYQYPQDYNNNYNYYGQQNYYQQYQNESNQYPTQDHHYEYENHYHNNYVNNNYYYTYPNQENDGYEYYYDDEYSYHYDDAENAQNETDTNAYSDMKINKI